MSQSWPFPLRLSQKISPACSTKTGFSRDFSGTRSPEEVSAPRSSSTDLPRSPASRSTGAATLPVLVSLRRSLTAASTLPGAGAADSAEEEGAAAGSSPRFARAFIQTPPRLSLLSHQVSSPISTKTGGSPAAALALSPIAVKASTSAASLHFRALERKLMLPDPPGSRRFLRMCGRILSSSAGPSGSGATGAPESFSASFLSGLCSRSSLFPTASGVFAPSSGSALVAWTVLKTGRLFSFVLTQSSPRRLMFTQ